MKLKNKTVLITGSSRGIGKSVAQLFIAEGARIILTSKDSKKLKKTSNEINADFFPADIRNEKEVEKTVKYVIKKFGRIDVLINNAGILPKMKPLHLISEKEWNDNVDVNLTGHFRFTKHVLPHMFKRGGSIINMSSDAGLKGFENFYADSYSAAKAGIIQLTKSWAIEYAKYNIRVNCICSAVVDTDMTKEFWLSSAKKKEITKKSHPLRRIGTGNDIAQAALYFASDDSSWTTGAILNVDGGVAAK